MKTRVQFLPIFAALLSMVLALWGCEDISVLTAFKTAQQGKPNAAGQVATPTFSITSGIYSSDLSVTITDSTNGATIYYTTNGTTPTTSSTLYNGAISVAGNGTTETIEAIATMAGMTDSAVASATYIINYSQVSTPQFNPIAGIYATAQTVTISTTTAGAFINYTTDGSTPTSSGGAPAPVTVTVSASETIKAIAYKAGYADSTVPSATYILPVAAPTFSPAPGTYNSAQTVTISTTTPGASILYTTDGSNPSTYGTVYSAPISVTTSETIKAIAFESGWSDSVVSSAAYTIHYPGTLDTAFATGAGASSAVLSVAVQSDGKVLIGGNFTTYNGTSRGYVARLNSDGSLDTGFLATGAGASSAVLSVAVQSDGKILIGGYFWTYNGTSRWNVARLNSDGSLDTGFLATGVGANGDVDSVAVQSDGKVLIGGNFTTYNGTSRGRVARLNSDGSLDTTFATGVGADSGLSSVAVQSDGKILIGGWFSTYNGINVVRVARLNSDGSLDTTFTTGAGANSSAVLSVAMQSDGKILIGGDFTAYNGTARGRVARLNSDGSLDTGFLATGVGANSYMYSVAVQSDGKILIGGAFTTYNGINRGYVARLNSDGSLDTTFTTGAGANLAVNSVAVQSSDGKILIGGNFSTYNGTSRGFIARLWN